MNFERVVIPIDFTDSIIHAYDAELSRSVESTGYIKTLNGKGAIVYKNGNRYEGEILNGLLQGSGIFYWTNGIKFIGNFSNNQIVGKGRYEWPDGSWYEGDIKSGLRDGSGTYNTQGDECIYEGEWKEGLRHGKGTLRFKSGAEYVGEFQRGLKHGKGKMLYPTGNYYEGSWAFDKKEGYGIMNWTAKNEKYCGEWVDNRQEGWGIHIWLEGKGDGKFLRNRYEGEWRNGCRNGVGVFYYSNGAKYEGEWKDNLKHGFCHYTYEDGKVFRGFFKEDKMIINSSTDTSAKKVVISPLVSPNVTSYKMKRRDSAKSKSPGPSSMSSMKKSTGDLHKTIHQEAMVQSDEPEANPYENMIDIYDLFADDPSADQEIKEVKNLLLRLNGDLKGWYRHFVSKQHDENEDSFALTNRCFWKILRDCRVLTPKANLAAINRLFIRGRKNLFLLNTSRPILRNKMKILKRKFFEDYPEEIHTFRGIDYEADQDDSGTERKLFEVNFFTEERYDVHDENRVLFYRHFIEGLIRAAYLRYGGGPHFYQNIEKFFSKLRNGMLPKKKSKTAAEDELILSKAKPFVDAIKQRLKLVFENCSSDSKSKKFENIDYSLTIQELVDIFRTNGYLSNPDDLERLAYSVERVYDPEDIFSQEKKSERDKVTSIVEKEARDGKLISLLSSEIIFIEFLEIIKLYLLKKEFSTLKDNDIKDRFEKFVEKLELYVEAKRQMALEVEIDIAWPSSEKDYFDERAQNLAEIKREREIKEAIDNQLRIEKENEERENRKMKAEDIDIADSLIKPRLQTKSNETETHTESSDDGF